MKHFIMAACAALILVSVCGAFAAEHRAASADDVARLCKTAQPGDIIVLADGTYTDQHIVLKANGAEGKPITLRAATPGKVVLNGASQLSIGGDWLVVDGLLFQGGALESGSVIEFRGYSDPHARHCVLRNAAVIDYNPPSIDTRYFWVSVYGSDNTIENCRFTGQTHSGVTLCVWPEPGKRSGHTIRRNYFGDRPRGNKNGFETIRIGTSKVSMTAAKCLVAENLFERCDGEIEIISNKSCENVYRGNTFRDCSGCMTLRHGNRCVVENNVFLGGDANGAGGVRVIGEGHRVAGNWFSGTKGRAGGAISLQAGIPDSVLSGYFQVKDAVIDGNVFVDNPGTLFDLDAGYGRRGCKLLPENVTISNNVMIVPDGAKPVMVAKQSPTGIVWKKNTVVGGELGIEKPEGIELVKSGEMKLHIREAVPLKASDVGPAWWRH